MSQQMETQTQNMLTPEATRELRTLVLDYLESYGDWLKATAEGRDGAEEMRAEFAADRRYMDFLDRHTVGGLDYLRADDEIVVVRVPDQSEMQRHA